MYGQFFAEDRRGYPYLSQEEAMEDIQALADLYLNLAFYNRNPEEERLDMRGVVITPQEFAGALTAGTLAARCETEPGQSVYRMAVRREAGRGKEHLEIRVEESGKSPGGLPPVHKLTRALSLTWQERFCFYLALLSDRDRKYERIFGYIQDNIAARQPTLGLGISLYRLGEEEGKEEGDEEGRAMRVSSPLWQYLLEDTKPGDGESRLSRPMAVRENVYRYLNGEGWIWGWWKTFAHVEIREDKGRACLQVSLTGLLDAYQSRNNKDKAGLWEIVSGLALAGRVEGMELSFSGAQGLSGRQETEQLAACMEQAGLGRPELNELGPCAVRVHCAYAWEDLILEETQKELMRHICSQARYRERVKSWGFGGESTYGNGISAVFYGAPGTGKTMAAQVMGKELGIATYKIDLSQLMSKYIGETEKNLNQLFGRAGARSAILFFDEADGLFARRSSVESSNDRYANMETGYLLQKFEEYEGIVILATNYIHNIDEAFKRRIKFFVRFTFPDQAARLCLWKSIMPEKARVDEPILYDQYAARFELSGSDIRSALTNAAYMAAAEGRGIRNRDIEAALKIHYLKMGRKLDDREFR